MSGDELWAATLEFLKARIQRQAFETWLAPTRILALNNGTVRVAVPNHFFADWLQHHYLGEILFALKTVAGRTLEVEFVPAPAENSAPAMNTGQRQAFSFRPSAGTTGQFRLRSHYTFDTFIVGESNRLAWAAARNVAHNLGQVFNPLFIYGGVGLGKTHLLQAIGNAALALRPGLRLCYTPAEALFLELIQAIEKNTRLEFKEKYRGLDLLLLDDIHYLVGKEGLQEEIFYTFNALQDAGSQVVFTSDRPPKDIPTLQERLVSRLGSGLVVDIQPPDLEMRIAILLQKAKMDGFELAEDIACYIANRVRSNVRTLEACLVRLMAMHSLTGRPINTALAEEALSDLVHPEEPMDAEKVIRVVSEHFQVPVPELKGPSRTKRIAIARQVAMYLLRSRLNLSLKDIGYQLGGKDHTTVLHAIEKIERLLVEDPGLKGQIDRLLNLLDNNGR